jgi:hypothetical protein
VFTDLLAVEPPASRSAVVTSHDFQAPSRSGCERMNWIQANAHASSTMSGDAFTR